MRIARLNCKVGTAVISSCYFPQDILKSHHERAKATLKHTILVLSLLLLAACGAGNDAASPAPAAASGNSSAGVDGQLKPLVDGAALWLEGEKKLVIVMTTIPLTADQRAGLAAADSDLMQIEGNQPYLKVAINLADPDKPLEPGNVTAWRVAFWNFHPKDPMTINRMKAEDLTQLGGRLAPGSSITFGINTTLDWTMAPARKYECRLSHTVPLLKGR